MPTGDQALEFQETKQAEVQPHVVGDTEIAVSQRPDSSRQKAEDGTGPVTVNRQSHEVMPGNEAAAG